LPGVRLESGRRRRRLGHVPPAQPDDPPIALDRQRDRGHRLVRPGRQHQRRLPGPEVAGPAAVEPGRIGDPGLHLDLGRRLEAQRAEPPVGAGAAPRAVDHQRRVERLAGVQFHAGDQLAATRQPGHRDLVVHHHPGQRGHPGAQHRLELRPGHRDHREPGRGDRPAAAQPVRADVRAGLQGGAAEREQLLLEPGEQRGQFAQAADQQDVRVLALRHAAPGNGTVRQGVPFQHGDGRVPPAEHPGGGEAGDAGPDHDGSVVHSG
jgi:hypothetical protein